MSECETLPYLSDIPESSDVLLPICWKAIVSRPEDRGNGVGNNCTGQMEVSGCVWLEENDLNDLHNRLHHVGDDRILQDCVCVCV